MDTMKKILFVVDERKMGGVSILLEDMLKMLNLKNKKIDILVLHNNGDRLTNLPKNINIIYGSSYFEPVDLPIKEVLKSKKIKLILKKIKLVLDMKTGFIKYKIKSERKKILKEEYDIEIAFKDGFTALFVGFGNCKNKIYWLHYDYKVNNVNKNYNKLFKNLLPKFNKIIAVSKGVMDDFNNIYNLKDKTQVINNLVNIDKIKNMSNEPTNIKYSQKIKLISVGRLHAMKGYDRLIKAIKKLETEKLIDNICLDIYGDGPEKENLIDLVNTLGLTKIVKFIGNTNNPYNKMKYYDFFVLSSIYEPFGLVIVESMTLGVPVLATSNAATFELINNNKNGLVVENNIDGIYNGLKQIINNPYIINNFKKELKKYDYEKENKKILKQLEMIFK